MDPVEPPDKPRWTFTWLLRIQRSGRTRRVPAEGGKAGMAQWIVLLILLGVTLVEIGIAIWLDLLPR